MGNQMVRLDVARCESNQDIPELWKTVLAWGNSWLVGFNFFSCPAEGDSFKFVSLTSRG